MMACLLGFMFYHTESMDGGQVERRVSRVCMATHRRKDYCNKGAGGGTVTSMLLSHRD
jgi:hypothetical protein